MALTPGPNMNSPANTQSLAGGMGGGLDSSLTQAPVAPNVQESNPYQAPAPPQVIQDNRTGTQKLLSGLLSGLAGGAAASPSEDNGGILGLHNAQQNDALYQQHIQQQNELQQRQFNDQVTQLQQQRANASQITQDKLDGARLAEANLHNLQVAYDTEHFDETQKVEYAKKQADLVDALKRAGMSVQYTDATHANLDQLHQQNPGLSSAAYMIHIPQADGHDQVAVIDPNGGDISADEQQRLMEKVGRPWPKGYKASPKDFLTTLSNAAKDQADNITKENIAKTRAAASKKAGSGTGTGTPSTSLDAEIEAAHSGDAIPTTFLSGRSSSKDIKAFTDAWIKKHPEDAPIVQMRIDQSKRAQDPVLNRTLEQGRSLFQAGGGLDKIEGLLQQIPTSEYPALNKAIASGSYQGGNTAISSFMSIYPDIAGDLAAFNTGAGGTTDLKVRNALDQIRVADNRQQRTDAIQTLREIGASRYRGIVGAPGNQRNKFITNKFSPEDFNRVPPGGIPGRLNGKIIGYKDKNGNYHEW